MNERISELLDKIKKAIDEEDLPHSTEEILELIRKKDRITRIHAPNYVHELIIELLIEMAHNHDIQLEKTSHNDPRGDILIETQDIHRFETVLADEWGLSPGNIVAKKPKVRRRRKDTVIQIYVEEQDRQILIEVETRNRNFMSLYIRQNHPDFETLKESIRKENIVRRIVKNIIRARKPDLSISHSCVFEIEELEG